MVSRSHRFVAESRNIMAMRYRLGNLDPYLCVFIHSKPKVVRPPHPATLAQTGPFKLVSGSTSRILFCDDGLGPYRAAPIKMARSGSSASLINKKKMPLNIQQSVVIEGKVVYGVDGDGQIFHFTPSTTSLMFTTDGIVEPNPENRNDWFLFEKEVKGLEELQQQHIIKICSFSEKTIAIFWDARWPQQGLGALVCRDFHEETPGRRGVVEGLGEH
ncbi:hypothetical protein HID58_018654 [Brassica napus]|uniref:Uncharacterized protein n=1 Tax=Brassica napus TaxID=3708 RepID=A0ABQ8DAJ9_BRANA|nr:hypothetical protein HID58_018654 [Brassica napus]